LTRTTASHRAFIIVSNATTIVTLSMQLSHLTTTEKILSLSSTFT
jgi:hypothetical protein